MKYTITGELKNGLTKSIIINSLKGKGHTYWSHATLKHTDDKVDFVIADFPSTNRKYREALEYNILIIDSEQALNKFS